MDIKTVEGMNDTFRAKLLKILQTHRITLAQINFISQYLNYIALEGDDNQKKTACCYLLVTRTNLPYACHVRTLLANFERTFRTNCTPLLDKLSAFMPNEYLEETGQENLLPPPTKKTRRF